MLKNNPDIILENRKLLARFLRKVHNTHDSPSLIRLVAGNMNHLVLCGATVNAGREADSRFFNYLSAECSLQGLDTYIIQKKLRPVALALGLSVSSDIQADYYDLLGITPDADTNDIKRAYRKLAYKTHPDTGSKGQDSSQTFIELNAAYQTLVTKDLRHQYDLSRNRLGLWKEQGGLKHRKLSLNPRHLYQFGALLVFFVLTALVSNYIFQKKAIFDEPYYDIQADIVKTKSQNEEAAIENRYVEKAPVESTDDLKGDLPEAPEKKMILTGSMEYKLYQPEPAEKHLASSSDKPVPESPVKSRPEKKKAPIPAVKASSRENDYRPAPVAETKEKIRDTGHKQAKLVPVNEKPFKEKSDEDSHSEDINQAKPLIETAEKDRGTGYDLTNTEQQVKDMDSQSHTSKPLVSAGDSRRKIRLADRLQYFLHDYCRTYEQKRLAEFTGFFTPDAIEMGKPFHKLLSTYRNNFETIDLIKYVIEPKEHSRRLDTGDISMRGNFSLKWCRYGESWQESEGSISMILIENADSFLIKKLNYSFK